MFEKDYVGCSVTRSGSMFEQNEQELNECKECVPAAPFDFAGITGCLCYKHNGNWCMHVNNSKTHNPGCPEILKGENK